MERRLQAMPLSCVRVTDAFAHNALEREIDYLLSLQEGGLLAGFYENAGLKTSFVRYGGWEDMLIGGHTLGHYLTALAQAYVNPAVSEEKRSSAYRKLEKIVLGLADCQAHSKGESGFLWGARQPVSGGVEGQFDHVEVLKTDIIKEAWVPWYTMHKLLGGLVETYRLTGYAPALTVAKNLGDWVYRRISGWDGETNARVLSVEYGGMNDCLYSLFELTGGERYARAAHAFDEEPLFDAILSAKKDVLKDKHANTTIPKILGALNRYENLHNKVFQGVRVDATRYLEVAKAFFRMVIERHTYVTGGNSEWEHFGTDFVLDAERTNCNCETCNVYNMLKLARGLFCITGDCVYADYYDNAFTNSILSSQNPETGMTTYFQPMAGGYFKCFSTPYDKFWCCTGSGMENFTKLGDGMFYIGSDGVYVERYLSSECTAEDFLIAVKSDFPLNECAEIKILRAKSAFKLNLRIPDWCAGEPSLTKNGVLCGAQGTEYFCVDAFEGDVFLLHLPVTVTVHPLPDGDAVAFCYGGAVLSADLGRKDMRETETGVSVTLPAERKKDCERVFFKDIQAVKNNPEKYLLRNGDTFDLAGGDVTLRFGLHYRRYRERYAIYIRLLEGERTEERETRIPFDTVQCGYGQYEGDELHELDSVGSVGVTSDGTYRYAESGGYFSYDVAVDPEKKNALSLLLMAKDNGKPLVIKIGGETIFSERLLYTLGEESYRREIEISQDIIMRNVRQKCAYGKNISVVRVRFEGAENEQSARVCGFLYSFSE